MNSKEFLQFRRKKMKSRFEYRVSVLKSILPYAKKTSVYIGISLLLGIIIFATGVITPLLYRSFIDSVVLGGNFSVFTHIAIGYVVLYSITSSAKYINSLVNINFGNSMILNLKRRMLEYYFSLSHEDYSLLSTGYDFCNNFRGNILHFSVPSGFQESFLTEY